MGLFSRLRRRQGGGASSSAPGRAAAPASAYLADWAASRRGVEAYVEPATTVTPSTLLLIAHDGEWTRRPVPDRETAFGFARGRGMPVYDVNLTGYPQRMRDYNARQRSRGAALPDGG